jgi:hypothetical protein
MRTLPFTITTVSGTFAPLVSTCVFERAKLLLVGAILAPGRRIMASVLRVMRKGDDSHVQHYPRGHHRAL